MSRRISTQKRFPEKDTKYDNLLVSLLINRILKSGKKRLAKRIVYKAFELIEFRTNENPDSSKTHKTCANVPGEPYQGYLDCVAIRVFRA